VRWQQDSCRHVTCAWQVQHAPLLVQRVSRPIGCLLLGDSMLERFKTTGCCTQLGSFTFPHILNAGVGGDRIQNVIYHLGNKDLLQSLKSHGSRNVILHVGTSDLGKRNGLPCEVAIHNYGLIVQALRRAQPDVNILITGLMPRKDIPNWLIEDSNAAVTALATG
jgi:hypothetical protein